MTATMLLVLITACKPTIDDTLTGDLDSGGGTDSGIADDTGTTGDTGDTGEIDTSEWDEASLVIITPLSASFLPLGEDAEFQAIVYNAAGEETDWEDIEWTSDIDTAWSVNGNSFVDNSLDAGTHAITAVARLPNGDRLASTVGGIWVQDENAGTYTGQMSVDIAMDYSGTEYIVTCIGAATLVVDVYGEVATGESSCTTSLQGYDVTANHVFDFAIDEGVVSGEAAMDFNWFDYPFDAEGAVSDGELVADWADEVYGYAGVTGELDVTRISRDTTYAE